jgi:hypothetical protein
MDVSVAIGNKLLLLPHVAILTQLQNVTVIWFGGIVWLDLNNARKTVRFGTFFFGLLLGKLGL